jgi:hypothetical protein
MNGKERPHTDDARSEELQTLLERYIERHLVNGESIDPFELCADRQDLVTPLSELIQKYHKLSDALEPGGAKPEMSNQPTVRDAPLPRFEGFRTIERLGAGGAGEVYKLEDLALSRVVAAKVLRRDSAITGDVADFLKEARILALFDDPHVVRVLEFRLADPPFILMEYVDGFSPTEIGPSLEYKQRARIVAEIAEAIDRAHRLGVQHRDLKPTNILLDASLKPKILDFGLSSSDPARGHGAGTLAYMAPEQFDRSRSIDARADIYALGVILYELLSGEPPFGGESDEDVIAAINAGETRLPAEIEPDVPEPLQAIALKAMEREPEDRYASAREMALDLRRFIDGRPVLARPSLYRSALGRRIRPQLSQIREWERLRLVYPHEAERLRRAYRPLEAREDDWIVASRVLSFSQIALYLGAFLLLLGGLLYFFAYQKASDSSTREPFRAAMALGAPWLLLSAAAERLFRRDHKAVAVAFFLGGAVLLPPLLLIILKELGLWTAPADSSLTLFDPISNRQLQAAAFLSCLWAFVLALRTRTVALSSAFTMLIVVTHLALLGDRGLKRWLEEGSWDVLAAHLIPLFLILSISGRALEVRGRLHFPEPLYIGSTAVLMLLLELVALRGKAFAHLGVSLAPLSSADVTDPTLLDTIATMTINGVVFYITATLIDRRGTPLMRTPAWILFSVSPFAMLEPLAYLVGTGEYSRRFDWAYLAMAVVVAVLSRYRQRRSFYFAGLTNTAVALLLITDHYEWLDRAGWAVTVVVAGILALVAGLAFHLNERHRNT